LRKTWGYMRAAQFPAIGEAFVPSEFIATAERCGHAIRVREQRVFRPDAGDDHAVPVLVGDFPDQGADALFVASVLHVAHLAAVQAAARLSLFRGEVCGRLRLTHTQMHQGGAGGSFGYVAGRLDGAFQTVRQGLAEGNHSAATQFSTFRPG